MPRRGSRVRHSFEERIAADRHRHIDIDVLRQATLERAAEHELKLKLAAQLIDIGCKALASKLHPDKGGSPEAVNGAGNRRQTLTAIKETDELRPSSGCARLRPDLDRIPEQCLLFPKTLWAALFIFA